MSKVKRVYIVLEVVDLGDHIVSVHLSERIAQAKADELNSEHKRQYGEYARSEQFWVASEIVQH